MTSALRTTLAAALLGAAALTAGCGSDGRRPNELRPPAPILLSASIGPAAVTLSPSGIGAGPVTLVIANLTGRTQRVTLEAAAGGMRRVSGPIAPRDTARLAAQPGPGLYRLRVVGGMIAPATLRIGPRRISSQQDLMLP